MPNSDARDRLVESLNASSLYGSNITAKPVSEWLGLTTYTKSRLRFHSRLPSAHQPATLSTE